MNTGIEIERSIERSIVLTAEAWGTEGFCWKEVFLRLREKNLTLVAYQRIFEGGGVGRLYPEVCSMLSFVLDVSLTVAGASWGVSGCVPDKSRCVMWSVWMWS